MPRPPRKKRVFSNLLVKRNGTVVKNDDELRKRVDAWVEERARIVELKNEKQRKARGGNALQELKKLSRSVPRNKVAEIIARTGKTARRIGVPKGEIKVLIEIMGGRNIEQTAVFLGTSVAWVKEVIEKWGPKIIDRLKEK